MKKKIVILITGQKNRLELSSKIKNIYNPLSKIYDVVMVLSLSESNNFTNKHNYTKNFHRDLCEINKELDTIPYYINDIEYPKLKINDNLVSMYDKKPLGKKFTKCRALNHVRQYYTFSKSWSKIKEINPDILIRIRDDACLSRSLNLTDFAKVINPCKKCIISSDKKTHGGINDKFAIVSNKAIKTYLKKPLFEYNRYNKDTFNKRIKNPEQFYKYVYGKNGISLLSFDININILGHK